ncbi:hypothetical protein TSUD_422420 [Trifolium subterraneum]|uniref:Uncharacterized protein n=1 Tax=Trifolium subterraneum TaxID=3900 RepID=A0A1B5Z7S6_TRISU|nr:hypothetical protein TSUD_422420 [Trifolium subterraneum]
MHTKIEVPPFLLVKLALLLLRRKRRRERTLLEMRSFWQLLQLVSPHISPRPIPQVFIPTDTSNLPSNDWRAKLALDDRGGETQSAWDVHFSGKGVIPHYITPSDIELIKEIDFEQSLEAVRTYSLWSTSLAHETSKTLKEELSRYVENLRVKTDVITTLKTSLKTTEDDLATSHSKFSELESKMKSLQVSHTKKEKKFEENVKELEKRNKQIGGNMKELEKKDKRIYALERSCVKEYDIGFSRALEQLEVLHPGLDTSGADSRFVVEEGEIVDPEARSTFGVVTSFRTLNFARFYYHMVYYCIFL